MAHTAHIEDLLADVNGNTIISIDTCTNVALKGGKANPMQGRVHKIMIGGNVMVFTNKKSNGYENMVMRRLAQEGKDPASFELKPRKWGTRIEGTPFVEHKNELYLEVIFLRPGRSHYVIDGNVHIDRSAIIGLEDPVVNEEQQGGLENKVFIRTFKIDSITAITVNGQRHEL